MNRSGDQFFARAGLAKNQNRRVRDRHLLDVFQHTLQRFALSENLVKPVDALNLFPQIRGFRRQRMNLAVGFESLIDVPQDKRSRSSAARISKPDKVASAGNSFPPTGKA